MRKESGRGLASREERKKKRSFSTPVDRCRFFLSRVTTFIIEGRPLTPTRLTSVRYDEKFLIRDPRCRTRIRRVINSTRNERGRTGMHISQSMHSLVRSITAREMKANNVSKDINIDGYHSIVFQLST